MLGHNRKMSGAECLADMLKGYGVTHVFHVPAVLRKTFAVMESRTSIKRLHAPNLARSGTDLIELGVAQQARSRIFVGVPIAAKKLDRVERHDGPRSRDRE